jgi:hypothetical protein
MFWLKCQITQSFKRFIVFTWSEYDNVSPLDCIDDSFDSSEQAVDHINRNVDSYGYAIFDCEKMRVITRMDRRHDKID